MTIDHLRAIHLRAIHRAGDATGTIPRWDAARLWPGQPERHTETPLVSAMARAGATAGELRRLGWDEPEILDVLDLEHEIEVSRA